MWSNCHSSERSAFSTFLLQKTAPTKAFSWPEIRNNLLPVLSSCARPSPTTGNPALEDQGLHSYTSTPNFPLNPTLVNFPVDLSLLILPLLWRSMRWLSEPKGQQRIRWQERTSQLHKKAKSSMFFVTVGKKTHFYSNIIVIVKESRFIHWLEHPKAML